MSNIPGLNITDPVVPTDTLDTHPTHLAQYGKGGYRSFATILERDSIPPERREVGMEVYVAATDKSYVLKPGITNSDWQETLSTYYIDDAIENNAVIATYKRGYNQTGSQIDQYKFVTLDDGYYLNYPAIKVVDSYDYPVLGLVLVDVPNFTSIKFPNYTVLQLPNGILDTTLAPIRSPIYCNSSGDFTLTWTPLQVGFVLTQATNPRIYLKIYEPKDYREIVLTAVTLQTIVHNLGYVPNIIIMDSIGKNITDSISVVQDENDITIESNIPITGKLIYK